MDEFEKVEKLRQRANVSYEEAKEALSASNGDLLDAMIYLEKQGKVAGEKKASENVTVESNEICLPACCDSKKEKKNSNKEGGEKFKGFCKTAWQKGCDNEFVVCRRGDVIIRIPVWAMILIVLFTFHITLPLMLISLFFGCRYSFEGKDNLSKVNEAMEKVGNAADKVKEEFTK